jgi:hypothetical protein
MKKGCLLIIALALAVVWHIPATAETGEDRLKALEDKIQALEQELQQIKDTKRLQRKRKPHRFLLSGRTIFFFQHPMRISG